MERWKKNCNPHMEKRNDLDRELADYLHWYNHFRLHGTLQYQSPIEFKQTAHKKMSKKVLTVHLEDTGVGKLVDNLIESVKSYHRKSYREV
ncbi:IS3 family transposase [Shouchella patagoniensis]|uniref:IS3 family transposase n=1 Tax=Shouchella patagoniensis TaxID=228576 RepID=UPI0009954FC1|nr:IS3 family transposase [Shouchella patagoniensis]